MYFSGELNQLANGSRANHESSHLTIIGGQLLCSVVFALFIYSFFLGGGGIEVHVEEEA